ncbi:hypothetical protein GH714_037336 [Hevea brasiliensis]|uniref:Uncharacterized protein n=1 Tax=Hevea brasiliensis TaxID=3981 RepID=A0A6A6MMN3_HEVBR|nr:hypothetical protein GH714_037336 [Hevea brasiliensis]
MELYGRNQAMNGSQSGQQLEWSPAGGETGLEVNHIRSGPARPTVCIICEQGFVDMVAGAAIITLAVALGVEAAVRATGEYPERVGEPPCQFYLKTGTCKFGASCKFHHPKHGGGSLSHVPLNTHGYPLRPGEKECSYYLKTGQCKFGLTCKFHHPHPAGTSMPESAPQFYQPVQSPSITIPDQYGGASTSLRVRPPILPGSYVQGAYGPVLFPLEWFLFLVGVLTRGWATSLYGITQLSSSAPAAGPYPSPSSAAGLSIGIQKEQPFPERPGEPECQYYLRTGDCKFGSSCRYHHPRDRVMPRTNCVLSPLGLPLRPGVQPCTFYLRNGNCKFGATCKFDHPMGSMRYSPSASSLIDMPVAPYPVGSLLATLAPSSSSSELLPELIGVTKKDPYLSRIPSSGNTSSSSVGLIFSQTGSVSLSELQHSSTRQVGERSWKVFIMPPFSRAIMGNVLKTTSRPISDVSSDLTVEIGASSFALHKFPLVSRSGRIRKLLLEAKDSKVTHINIPAVPGGAEAFELAAKFCYGVNAEITLSNVAMLLCTAHFLEMTEDFAEKNLEARGEAYLKEIVLPNISSSISVLHRCEALLPISEEINIVSRLINAIASNACKEQLTSGLLKLDHNFPAKQANMEPETPSDWWGKSLTVLNLDFFQRVLSAVKSKGLKQDMISKILINYAYNSLQGLAVKDPHLVKGSLLDVELQKKQRVTVEAIVSLLPTQSRKSPVPMAFLSSLLKTAIAASATTACRSDLERRIGLQLDQAILEDILIPANSHGNSHSTMYDADSILRIFSMFLNLDEDDDEDNHLRDESEMVYDFDSPGSPKQSSILKVSKLLDNYLAEVALDTNLMSSKFIALAELLPDHARIVSDGLYRAVDIFLKVHPNIKDSERYRLCKTIDCQKLSQEACSHAAQNERLPVQMAVQVLYFEQIRLRNAMNGGHNQFFFGAINGQFPQRSSSGAGSGAISPRDNYASLEQEMETVIKVLQPGPLVIVEHKFSAEEIHEAKATVRRAVENWRRNANLEHRSDILKYFIHVKK